MQTEEDGKVFPTTRRSADILEILLAECRKQGVTIRCNEPVEGITRAGGSFTVTTATGTYFFTAVAITTGGASYPQCGTTGDGYRLAASLGQPVTEIGPALTPLLIRPLPVCALLWACLLRGCGSRSGGREKKSQTIPAMSSSRTSGFPAGYPRCLAGIRPGDVVRLSFAGPMRREEFAADILKRAAENPGWEMGTILAKYPIPERLNRKLLKISGIPDGQKCAHFSAALACSAGHELHRVPADRCCAGRL